MLPNEKKNEKHGINKTAKKSQRNKKYTVANFRQKLY